VYHKVSTLKDRTKRPERERERERESEMKRHRYNKGPLRERERERARWSDIDTTRGDWERERERERETDSLLHNVALGYFIRLISEAWIGSRGDINHGCRHASPCTATQDKIPGEHTKSARETTQHAQQQQRATTLKPNTYQKQPTVSLPKRVVFFSFFFTKLNFDPYRLCPLQWCTRKCTYHKKKANRF